MTDRARGARRGVTIIELIIAMVVGLVVLGTVTSYVGTTDRNMNAATAREDYARKARFLGLALRRDIGEAGVAIESTPTFGSVAVFGDTVSILKVPFQPNQEQPYNLATNPPLASVSSNASQNCGNSCMRLRRLSAGTALTITSGMIARIQSGTDRRLILINTVGTPGASDSIAVTFRSSARLLRRPSVLQASPISGMTSANTTVQRLDMVTYWRDASNNLWRATRMDPSTGNLVGEIVARGCTQFEVQLVFANGTVADSASATVAGQDYNDINLVRIRATIQSSVIDPRMNNGVPLERTYTWQIQPRNLIYERNRDGA
jgi:Tfp pilus assembly protein PilW